MRRRRHSDHAPGIRTGTPTQFGRTATAHRASRPASRFTPLLSRVCQLLLILLSLVLRPGAVFAHEMTMAELELRELSKGQFVLTWGASGTTRPIEQDLHPRWPEGCHTQELSLKCPVEGLLGELSIDGVGDKYSAALVRIIWLDGQIRVYTLTASQPRVRLYGAADDTRPPSEIARAYTILGVEHILSGIDHLLFVIGLLFLVGFRRRLIGTISAFTLAHSITLACSVLGIIRLRSAPVEASIA